jgi:hypothetical protein
VPQPHFSKKEGKMQNETDIMEHDDVLVVDTHSGSSNGNNHKLSSPRPDVAVRNALKSALGRMPTKEEVRRYLGLPENKSIPSNFKLPPEFTNGSKPKLRKVKLPSAKFLEKTKPMKKKTPYVNADTLSKDYITLITASKLTGVTRDVLTRHIVLGKLPAVKVDKGSRGQYMVKQSDVLARYATAPANSKKVRGKYKKHKAVKQAEVVNEKPTAPSLDNGLQNHISFAYGSVLQWLMNYAMTADVPPRSLATHVGEMLKRGGK